LPAQCFHLRIDVHTAEHHHRFQREVFAIGLHRFFNLGGEFACRHENQAARPAGARVGSRFCGQELQDRQRETRSLARAGLRTGQQVPAGQDQRDRLCLHRGWFGVARVGNRAHQRLCQIQSGESDFIVWQSWAPVTACCSQELHQSRQTNK